MVRYDREVVILFKPILPVDSTVLGNRFVAFGYLPPARIRWIIVGPILKMSREQIMFSTPISSVISLMHSNHPRINYVQEKDINLVC